MKASREESSRIHREFERFYAKYPQLRIQANHQMFLNAAEQDGGSETLTAEWLELQLDSLRGQLAVLSETPDEAFEKLFAQYPAFNFESNRRALSEHIRPRPVTSENLKQAFAELRTKLPFDKEVASEHTAQLAQQEREELARKETQEREDLARYIANVYAQGVPGHAQELQYKKMLGASTEYLRNRAAEIREKTRLVELTQRHDRQGTQDLYPEAKRGASLSRDGATGRPNGRKIPPDGPRRSSEACKAIGVERCRSDGQVSIEKKKKAASSFRCLLQSVPQTQT